MTRDVRRWVCNTYREPGQSPSWAHPRRPRRRSSRCFWASAHHYRVTSCLCHLSLCRSWREHSHILRQTFPELQGFERRVYHHEGTQRERKFMNYANNSTINVASTSRHSSDCHNHRGPRQRCPSCMQLREPTRHECLFFSRNTFQCSQVFDVIQLKNACIPFFLRFFPEVAGVVANGIHACTTEWEACSRYAFIQACRFYLQYLPQYSPLHQSTHHQWPLNKTGCASDVYHWFCQALESPRSAVYLGHLVHPAY